jgi:hypothetical protein
MTVRDEYRVHGFFTADHAAVVGGKLYVNGGAWDVLNFPAYPAQIPSISLIIVVRVPSWAYHEDHKLTVEIVDADEEPLDFRVEADFRIGAGAHMRRGDPTIMPVAVPVIGMTIPRAGDYSFVLKIDGNEEARFGVRAVQVQSITVPAEGDQDSSGDEEPE